MNPDWGHGFHGNVLCWYSLSPSNVPKHLCVTPVVFSCAVGTHYETNLEPFCSIKFLRASAWDLRIKYPLGASTWLFFIRALKKRTGWLDENEMVEKNSHGVWAKYRISIQPLLPQDPYSDGAFLQKTPPSMLNKPCGNLPPGKNANSARIPQPCSFWALVIHCHLYYLLNWFTFLYTNTFICNKACYHQT